MSIKSVDVAFYWSAREATAILDDLDRFRNLIWEYYGEEIKELRQEEVMAEAAGLSTEDQQAFSFDGNDSF